LFACQSQHFALYLNHGSFVSFNITMAVAVRCLGANDARFNHVEERLDDVKASVGRVENKLDPTIERVDELAARVTALEQPAA